MLTITASFLLTSVTDFDNLVIVTKNITLQKNADGITVHTPHGQVVIRVYGGQGFNMNETHVTVCGKTDGSCFTQAGDNLLMVYPEGVSNIHVVRVRDRGAIQMKEIGDSNDPTPLGKIALDFLKTNCKKAVSDGTIPVLLKVPE